MGALSSILRRLFVWTVNHQERETERERERERMTDIPPILPDDVIQQELLQQQQNDETTGLMASRQQQQQPQQKQHDDGGNHLHEEEMIMRQIHQQQQQLIQQEESVLAEILVELDRERHRRAEMEAKVRVLEEELHSERRRNDATNLESQKSKNKNGSKSPPSARDIARVEAERDGYKQIVEALTNDRPAFSASMKYHDDTMNGHKGNDGSSRIRQRQQNEIQQLPIHIVRLLEVMPWDARAQSYVYGHEQVYEWQVMGAGDKSTSSWKKELNHFPKFFKSLPVSLPSNGKTIQQQQHLATAFAMTEVIAPPKRCVLTNLDVTQLLNIDKGYPLPDDGGDWMWISNWQVEKTNDTDAEGWSYSNDYQIMASSTYYNEFIPPTKGQPAIVRRRRKWMRRRMLFNYPYASTMTQEYLKLLSQKAILDVTLDKLSSQLVDTKMGLTTNEAERFAFEERTNARIRQLEHEINEKNCILGLAATGNKNDSRAASTTTPNSKKPDQIAAEIGSAVQQWVSKIGHQHHRKQDGHEVSAVASTSTTNQSDDNAISVSATESGYGLPAESSPSMTAAQQQKDPPALSPPHSPKSRQHQLLFDSLRGKGTDFFEKFKQNAEQEIDKFKKHGLNGSSSHDNKKSNDKETGGGRGGGTSGEGDGDNSTTATKATTNASNVYVPAMKKKLETSTYNHSSFED